MDGQQRFISLVMAGGKGSRLFPLTLDRAKPAVPFGGRYRIVDFVLSNLANSGMRSVYLLTQYKSQSLAEHVQRTWGARSSFDAFVTVVPAQMRMGESWYRGTADSVFQNLHLIEEYRGDAVLVFGADHIYKMNIRQMTDFHFQKGAIATVACLPIKRSEAHQFGIVQVDEDWRVIGFQEKPDKDPVTIPGDPEHCLGSMGNYVFTPAPLIEELRADAERESHHDFGRNILPSMVPSGRVFAYNFGLNRIRGVSDEVENAYWRDVGTIDAYFDANMDLKNVVPSLNLYNWDWPIVTANYPDPPAKLVFDDETRRGIALQSIMCGGCIVAGGFVKDSVLGRNVFVDAGAEVSQSVLFDNVYVGRGAKLHRCIVDKNVRVPEGDHIGHDLARDSLRYTVSEAGVTVVQKAKDTIFDPFPEFLSGMSPPLPIALVIHGHFYQPPRENPWTDEVPREPSAAPFHDWNARIHAEAYRANAFARIHDGPGRIQAIVNNYERMSFNFGPTLARWIGRHDPEVERRLRDADVAQRKRVGHGGAVAQAYAHPIVPLCNAVDRRTQLRWGLSDFRRRFGRKAEGLWLPETAASPETLETLIELGVGFTILAPEQIAAVRPTGEEEVWQTVDRDSLDTGRAYYWRHRDGSGRRISLAVFDGELSRAVAFGETASRADSLLDAVSSSAERSKVNGQRLVLCASDGELWGHHKKFADLTVAFSTFVEAGRRGIGITNLGAHLARHPPTWEARLAEGPEGEGTAWSCSHGLGRWTDDCGCNMGGASAGSQAWRRPLRRALDLIRNAAASHYESAAGDLFSDPWGVRDAYGDVVDGTIQERDRALLALGRPALRTGGERARTRARQLLELQRATLLMYASCGWFFDDIAGLEASLVIRMGAHAMDLMRAVGARPPESAVLDVLAQARSNNRQAGTGADVFRRALASRVTAAHVVGTAALHELVAPGLPVTTPGFDIEVKQASVRGGKASGRARAEQRRTGVVADLTFAASAGPKGAYAVKVGTQQLTLADLGSEARAGLVMAALPALSADVGHPAVTALIVEAAREFPPNLETAEGLERRAALIRVLEALLNDAPSAAALRLAAELLTLLDLPPGAAERRSLEEAVWLLMQRGRPTAALRAVADELGFSGFDAVAAPLKATAT